MAAVFVALSVASVGHVVGGRSGIWLPLHLLLAGGAGTAISAVLPFFTAALAVARPADPRARVLAIAGVAGGAATISLAVPFGWTPIAVGGGLGYIGGIAVLAVVAFRPLREALGPRRRIVEAAYAAALLQVAIGAGLAILMLGGWLPVLERWGFLKPAHGWLNVFGFVATVIAATLVHLGPTVAGTRIRPRRGATVAIGGLLVGPPLVALGYTTGSDALARAGALATIVASVGLVALAVSVRRDRGRWTTDADWHAFTQASLLVAPLWFVVGVAIAAGRVLWLGADPSAWSIGLIAAPLAIGWVAQVLIGSWSHLVPAIGPGDPVAHARQRAVLGWAGPARVAGLNLGVGLLTVGVAIDSIELSVAGAVATVLAGVIALGALLVAIRVRPTRPDATAD